jgi:hypothetical protein
MTIALPAGMTKGWGGPAWADALPAVWFPVASPEPPVPSGFAAGLGLALALFPLLATLPALGLLQPMKKNRARSPIRENKRADFTQPPCASEIRIEDFVPEHLFKGQYRQGTITEGLKGQYRQGTITEGLR